MPTRNIALIAVALAQVVNQSPRELMAVERPLSSAEIAIVLAASRRAMAGRTLRLPSVFNSQGPQLRMGPAGLPTAVRSVSTIEGGMITVSADGAPPTSTRFVDEVTTFIDYTGRAARRCGGSIEPGEMVIEYVRHAGQHWTATARRRGENDVGGPGFRSAFAILRGAGSLASTDRGAIAGRPARAFTTIWVSPFTDAAQRTMVIGDPAPNVIGEPARDESIQTLWIDTQSILPLRWEVNIRGERTHGFDFTYEPIDLQPPAGVQAPDCIR